MINRRDFLKHTAVGVSVLNPLSIKATLGRTASTTPNVLFVFSDQHRAQSMRYAGCTDLDTPRFDAFATESVNYTNAVSTFPVCSPYRASLITGQYPLSTGMVINDLQLNTNATSIAQSFTAAGYKTGYIGKWHIDGNGRNSYIPSERKQGFEYWKVLECSHSYNNSKYYAGDSPTQLTWPGYDCYAQTNDAIEYLNDRAADQAPFALFLAWGPPHDPYRTGPTSLLSKYDAKALEQRGNVPAGKSQNALAGYYAHIEALDTAFGRLLDTLKANGLDDNTIVVFTSDHGDMIYSQDLYWKQLPWDESVRVPFLIRVPGNTTKTVDLPLGAPDVMPTLLGLCNIPIPATCEGQDLSGEIIGTVSLPNDRASLIMNPAPFDNMAGSNEWRGIRTKRYTFCRRLNPQSEPWLLFDNQTDPYQKVNLVNNPSYTIIQTYLDQQLKQLLCQTGDSFLNSDQIIERCGYQTDDRLVVCNDSNYWGQVTVPCRDNLTCDTTAPDVRLGPDMMTWSGEPVSLTANVDNNYGTELTYQWSAVDISGLSIVFTDPANPANPDPSKVTSPMISITKPTDTGSKTNVTVAVIVNNAGRTAPGIVKIMEIDVYDNACQLAGMGLGKPTKITGDDCVLDINDFKEVAKNWLKSTIGLGGAVKRP